MTGLRAGTVLRRAKDLRILNRPKLNTHTRKANVQGPAFVHDTKAKNLFWKLSGFAVDWDDRYARHLLFPMLPLTLLVSSPTSPALESKSILL